MGFLLSKSQKPIEEAAAPATAARAGTGARAEDVYADMVSRRPALVEAKLKIHELIIDEFNLAALEKLPPDELAKQVRTYVGNYARTRACRSTRRSSIFFPRRSSTR